MLVGEGAKQFANEQGVPDVPNGQLVTEFARQSLEEIKNSSVSPMTELGYVNEKLFQLICDLY
jgi:isoaspartyl peptidase/L-asparaginase-like protein (Ntn-hydrolase superfamily)